MTQTNWPQSFLELTGMIEHCGNVLADIEVEGDDDNEAYDIACELQQIYERMDELLQKQIKILTSVDYAEEKYREWRNAEQQQRNFVAFLAGKEKGGSK